VTETRDQLRQRVHREHIAREQARDPDYKPNEAGLCMAGLPVPTPQTDHTDLLGGFEL
jgi:hypothetical protein